MFAAPWVLDAYKAGAPDWGQHFGRKTLRIENAPRVRPLSVVERFSPQFPTTSAQ